MLLQINVACWPEEASMCALLIINAATTNQHDFSGSPHWRTHGTRCSASKAARPWHVRSSGDRINYSTTERKLGLDLGRLDRQLGARRSNHLLIRSLSPSRSRSLSRWKKQPHSNLIDRASFSFPSRSAVAHVSSCPAVTFSPSVRPPKKENDRWSWR